METPEEMEARLLRLQEYINSPEFQVAQLEYWLKWKQEELDCD